GWELHLPMEDLVATYEALWQAGAACGIRDFGVYAVDSLRLEKGYPGWKVELTHEYTPLMAGLERFVDFQNPGFTGMAALLEEAKAGPKERLVPLLLDEGGEADPPPCATVWQRESRVGLVASGGFAHTLQCNMALAYVRRDLAQAGAKLDIEILG